MSKRKTIDAFFKKKDVNNSEIRTPVGGKEVRPTLTIDSMRDVLRVFINGKLIGN